MSGLFTMIDACTFERIIGYCNVNDIIELARTCRYYLTHFAKYPISVDPLIKLQNVWKCKVQERTLLGRVLKIPALIAMESSKRNTKAMTKSAKVGQSPSLRGHVETLIDIYKGSTGLGLNNARYILLITGRLKYVWFSRIAWNLINNKDLWPGNYETFANIKHLLSYVCKETAKLLDVTSILTFMRMLYKYKKFEQFVEHHFEPLSKIVVEILMVLTKTKIIPKTTYEYELFPYEMSIMPIDKFYYIADKVITSEYDNNTAYSRQCYACIITRCYEGDKIKLFDVLNKMIKDKKIGVIRSKTNDKVIINLYENLIRYQCRGTFDISPALREWFYQQFDASEIEPLLHIEERYLSNVDGLFKFAEYVNGKGKKVAPHTTLTCECGFTFASAVSRCASLRRHLNSMKHKNGISAT